MDIYDNTENKENIPEKQSKAVAIKYDKEQHDAPHIIASGKGLIAEQIISLALANDIKVRKDEDLVELLSKIEIDSVIPLEAFTAIAEILSYIYKANEIYANTTFSSKAN